jgi:hypothetical protein
MTLYQLYRLYSVSYTNAEEEGLIPVWDLVSEGEGYPALHTTGLIKNENESFIFNTEEVYCLLS